MPQLKITPPHPMVGEDRSAASAFLDKILNPSGTILAPGTPPIPQSKPPHEVYPEDPMLEFATMLLQRQYPEATSQSPMISIDPTLQGKGIDGVRYGRSGNIGVNPSYIKDFDGNVLPKDVAFLRLMDLLRHELSHGVGVPDSTPWTGNPKTQKPTAYDVGYESTKLHKDINLPKDKK